MASSAMFSPVRRALWVVLTCLLHETVRQPQSAVRTQHRDGSDVTTRLIGRFLFPDKSAAERSSREMAYIFARM